MCSGFGASASFDLNGDNQDIYATGNTPEDAIHSVQEKMDRWLESVSNSSLKCPITPVCESFSWGSPFPWLPLMGAGGEAD